MCIKEVMAIWKFLKFQNFARFIFRVFLHGKMVTGLKGKRASAGTNLRLLWQMAYISTVTYTVWMILVPKERAWSKLHDDDKNFYDFFVSLPKMKERKTRYMMTAIHGHVLMILVWQKCPLGFTFYSVVSWTIVVCCSFCSGRTLVLGSALWQNFPPPCAIMLALPLDCSTASLTTHQKCVWN